MGEFCLGKFIAKVKALPVALGNIDRVLEDEIPMVEEVVGDLKLTATHQHMPTLGNVYAVTILETGPKAVSERNLMRAVLTRKLGKSVAEDMEPDRLLLFFMCEDQTIPKTEVHLRLGEERLDELCAKISAEERAVIEEALAAMEVMLRDLPAKAKAVTIIMGKLPPGRINPVNIVLLRIISEFAANGGRSGF